MLQITENSTRFERLITLAIEVPLPRVRQVVNGKTGSDDIEAPQAGKGQIQIMRDNFDPGIAGKSSFCRLEHNGRKIQRDAGNVRRTRMKL